MDIKYLKIDFSKPEEARTKATWSDSKALNLNNEGLGWEGDPRSSFNGWIQTKPMAVGYSHRAPYGVRAQVIVKPPPAPVVLSKGETVTPHVGDAYIRYSPDRRNWSTWQAIDLHDQHLPPAHKGVWFLRDISIPRRERNRYTARLQEYAKLDVPWSSDEEAAVRWILKREPRFFEQGIPFIGYVEFLFEARFQGGSRIKSLEARVSYGMSGMMTLPRDPSVRGREFSQGVPWRFVAEAVEESAANQGKPVSENNLD